MCCVRCVLCELCVVWVCRRRKYESNVCIYAILILIVFFWFWFFVLFCCCCVVFDVIYEAILYLIVCVSAKYTYFKFSFFLWLIFGGFATCCSLSFYCCFPSVSIYLNCKVRFIWFFFLFALKVKDHLSLFFLLRLFPSSQKNGHSSSNWVFAENHGGCFCLLCDMI